MGATEELLYSFPVRKSSDRVSVTDQLLYGDRATSGRQVGTGEFAPIEKRYSREPLSGHWWRYCVSG